MGVRKREGGKAVRRGKHTKTVADVHGSRKNQGLFVGTLTNNCTVHHMYVSIVLQ